MELTVSKVNRENKGNVQNSNMRPDQNEIERAPHDCARETVTFENGVSAHKQGGRYSISVGDQELEVTEEEMLRVTASPDYAFELIMEKRGKFWFNASIDNVGLNRETI